MEQLSREELFVGCVLEHTHGMLALRSALACSHPCIAGAAAMVAIQMTRCGRGRYTMLEHGCVPALMARCSAVEPLELRGATMHALCSILSGPEAGWHVHNLKPLLTCDTLMAVGEACLTSTVDKLERLGDALGVLDVAGVAGDLRHELNAAEEAMKGLPDAEVAESQSVLHALEILFERLEVLKDATVRLQHTLMPLQQLKATSLFIACAPSKAALRTTHTRVSAASWERAREHGEALLAVSDMAANLAAEHASMRETYDVVSHVKVALHHELKTSQLLQRQAERLRAATSNNTNMTHLLELERANLEAHQVEFCSSKKKTATCTMEKDYTLTI